MSRLPTAVPVLAALRHVVCTSYCNTAAAVAVVVTMAPTTAPAMAPVMAPRAMRPQQTLPDMHPAAPSKPSIAQHRPVSPANFPVAAPSGNEGAERAAARKGQPASSQQTKHQAQWLVQLGRLVLPHPKLGAFARVVAP